MAIKSWSERREERKNFFRNLLRPAVGTDYLIWAFTESYQPGLCRTEHQEIFSRVDEIDNWFNDVDLNQKAKFFPVLYSGPHKKGFNKKGFYKPTYAVALYCSISNYYNGIYVFRDKYLPIIRDSILEPSLFFSIYSDSVDLYWFLDKGVDLTNERNYNKFLVTSTMLRWLLAFYCDLTRQQVNMFELELMSFPKNYNDHIDFYYSNRDRRDLNSYYNEAQKMFIACQNKGTSEDDKRLQSLFRAAQMISRDIQFMEEEEEPMVEGEEEKPMVEVKEEEQMVEADGSSALETTDSPMSEWLKTVGKPFVCDGWFQGDDAKPYRLKPERDYVFPGFRRGSLGLLFAPGGTGKTYFGIELCMSVAMGQSIFENLPITKSGPSLIISFEEDLEEMVWRNDHVAEELDERRLKPPVAPMYTYVAARGKNLFLVDNKGHEVEENIQILTGICEGKRLVVLDSLSHLHQIDENNNVMATMVCTVLNKIALKTNCSILVIHHTNKGSTLNDTGNVSEAGRGATAWRDSARLVLNLSRYKEKETEKKEERANWLTLTWSKANGPIIEPINLERINNGVLCTPHVQRHRYREKYKELISSGIKDI